MSSCTYPTVLPSSSGLTSQLCTVARCGSKMANCVAYTVVQIKSQSTYDLQLVCSERYLTVQPKCYDHVLMCIHI